MEIIGAGVFREEVDALLDLGLAVDAELTVHPAEGAGAGGVVHQLVAAALRSGDRSVVEDHPRRIREEGRDRNGLSHAVGGGHGEILGVLVEVEGARRRAVVEAQVLGAPVLAGDPAAPGTAVTDDGALDGTDASRLDDVFPLGKELLRGDGAVILGRRGRVSAADDVEVALQHAVHDAAAVGEVRAEAPVRPQGVQGRAGGDDLDVGCGDEAPVGVVGGQGVSAQAHGQHAPGRAIQRRTALQLPYRRAEGGLCGNRRAERKCQKEDGRLSHHRMH